MRKPKVWPIVQYGHPALHRPCAIVTSFDKALGRLIDDMFASMYEANGVGLAANQIGVDAAVFVMDCEDADGVEIVAEVVNPTLLLPTFGGETILDQEGCLSVLGQYADIPRAATATVKGFDRTGEPVTVTASGVAARCLQHEVGHLQGQVYVDLLPDEQRLDILRAAGLA